jgi:hypothetical protein
MSRLKPALAFSCAAGAAWLSTATLALTDAAPAGDRVALLPLTAGALAIALAAAVAATIPAWRGRTIACLPLCGLILLPWFPIELPPALMLWSGPMALLPWTALLFSGYSRVSTRPRWQARHDPHAAATAAAILFSLCAWGAAPSVPGGDEPHYLIITQSLLEDGDLRIENNHARRDYAAYFAGDLRPDYLKRGIDGEIYSIHAPGLPALVAPAFLIAGYRGVVLFLILVSALASGLAWHVAWLASGRRDAAWFGWAAVTCAATTVFHSFSVYPDGIGGVLVLTGVWALQRAHGERTAGDTRIQPWLLHGAALALLPWLHSRFAILAGILGILVIVRLLQTRAALAKIVAFLVPALASAAGWFWLFASIYGTPSPSAPYGGAELGALEYVADGLAGLFFDQRFGLFTYAPVLICAAGGLAAMLWSRNGVLPPGARRLALEILTVAIPYVVLVTYFRMWWAGWSAPARFATPLLFMLAVPAASAWTAMRRRGTRVTAAAALCYSALVTAALAFVDGGRLAYNVRTANAQLFEWLSRNADLAAALPAWSDREAEFFRDIAVWCAVMLATWLLLRTDAASVRLRTRAALITATALAYASAAMLAATLCWSVKRMDGLNPVPAQLDLLAAAADGGRALAVGLAPPRVLSRASVAGELRLRPKRLPLPEDAPPGDQLLFAIPAVPAGQYTLRPRATRGDGRLTVSIGRGGPIAELALAATTDVLTLDLPVTVRAILVSGDTTAQRTVRGLNLEPSALGNGAAQAPGEFARDAVRYGDSIVYFLDDRSFAEPDGFWLGGGRSSSIVVQPRSTAPLKLHLGNGPVANTVTIQAGAWQERWQMQPGEERDVEIPFQPGRSSMRIELSASDGFVPARTDPASGDHRFLGVRITVD